MSGANVATLFAFLLIAGCAASLADESPSGGPDDKSVLAWFGPGDHFVYRIEPSGTIAEFIAGDPRKILGADLQPTLAIPLVSAGSNGQHFATFIDSVHGDVVAAALECLWLPTSSPVRAEQG